MGDWYVPPPIFTPILEPYGDKYNLYKTMAECDKIFWITNDNYTNDYITQYMKEHYDAEPVVVDSFGEIYYVVSFSQLRLE